MDAIAWPGCVAVGRPPPEPQLPPLHSVASMTPEPVGTMLAPEPTVIVAVVLVPVVIELNADVPLPQAAEAEVNNPPVPA